MKEEYTGKKSTVGVHFFYVALILVLVIILLATRSWTDIPGFVRYLSVAATITSLVLALLAIIYAFISNSSVYQAIGHIEKASTDLNVEIGFLKSTTQSLQDNTAMIVDSVSKVPGRLDDISSKLNNLTTDTETKMPQTSSVVKDVPSFIKHSSPNGQLLQYLCYLAKEQNKKISFTAMADQAQARYFLGYFVAMSAAGLIEGKREKGDYRIISVPEEFKTAKEVCLSNSKDEEKMLRIKALKKFEAELLFQVE